jgi:hypothetical protein
MDFYLNSIGLDKSFYAEKLKTLANKKKAIVCDKQIVYVDDNSTQLESVKLGLRLHGELDRSVENLSLSDNRQLNFIINDTDIDRLVKISETLTHLQDKLEERKVRKVVEGKKS